MNKSQQNPTNNITTPTNDHNNDNMKKEGNKNSNKVIWDCGSTLYDSVELDSFRKQLDSAIINSSRTLSMPRLPSQQPQPSNIKKPSSKLARSFQKLLKSVFRASTPGKRANYSGSSSPDPWFFDSPPGEKVKQGGGKYYVVYENKTGINGLSSIPEVGDEVNVSPQIGTSLVRKTMSDRFTALSPAFHCASSFHIYSHPSNSS